MTKQGSSSITGRGFRRRFRSLISRKKAQPTQQTPPPVRTQETQENSKNSSHRSDDTTQKREESPDTLPTPKTRQTPTPNPNPVESDKTTKPNLSFSERIARGQHNNSTIDLSAAPSFTSGPAALQAAQQLSQEASTNVNDTGESYWGPIDNESARSKADGQMLVIDQEECISCGTCVENTEQVFYLPDDAKAVPIEQEGPMDLIQDAIDACPVTCIHWTHSPQQYPQLNDQNGNPIT